MKSAKHSPKKKQVSTVKLTDAQRNVFKSLETDILFRCPKTMTYFQRMANGMTSKVPKATVQSLLKLGLLVKAEDNSKHENFRKTGLGRVLTKGLDGVVETWTTPGGIPTLAIYTPALPTKIKGVGVVKVVCCGHTLDEFVESMILIVADFNPGTPGDLSEMDEKYLRKDEKEIILNLIEKSYSA